MINWREYIVSDKGVLLGKPTIKNTRLSIDHLIGLLAQGWTEQQILDNYPRLSNDDLKAVFSYIQECLQDGLIYKLPKSVA